MDIIIRKIEESYLDRIMEIEKDAFSTPWSRESFLMEINENKLAKYVVAEVDGLVVGYGGFWLIIDEAHITNIAVIGDYRNKGVGKKILEGLIGLSLYHRLSSMTLEVRVSNEPAKKLYTSYGFQKVGIRPNYYADEKEDAIIMWKEL